VSISYTPTDGINVVDDHEEQEESRQQLSVPLLLSSGEEYDFDNRNHNIHHTRPYQVRQPHPLQQQQTNATMTTNNPNPIVSCGQILAYRMISIRYLSDCMPLLFYTLLTNGKYVAIGLLSVYLMIISLWLPFWLLSYMISEWGVYMCMIGTVFLIGRTIIRLIAFPGATRKVIQDIEAEFTKYSIRMIDTACISIIDLAIIFEPRDQSGEHLDSRTIPFVPGIWHRVQSFRCRVLAVYMDVLRYMYQQDSVMSLELSTNLMVDALPDTVSNGGYGPKLTRFGNNRLYGDVGNVLALSVGVKMIFHRNSVIA
jgi:hypothetical protein